MNVHTGYSCVYSARPRRTIVEAPLVTSCYSLPGQGAAEGCWRRFVENSQKEQAYVSACGVSYQRVLVMYHMLVKLECCLWLQALAPYLV